MLNIPKPYTKKEVETFLMLVDECNDTLDYFESLDEVSKLGKQGKVREALRLLSIKRVEYLDYIKECLDENPNP